MDIVRFSPFVRNWLRIKPRDGERLPGSRRYGGSEKLRACPEVMSLDKDETKAVVKAALKEWMDDKVLNFGRWSLVAVGGMVLTALVYFILRANGWSIQH